MSNTFNVSSLVSKGIVAPLHAEGKLVNACGTDYKNDFLQKNYTPGLTLTIDKGPQFSVTEGRVAAVQDVVHSSTTVSIVQYNEAISVTSIEKSYKMNDEESMMKLGRDMGRRMLREVDRLGFQAIAKAVGNSVGTPGAEPGSLRLFGRAAAFMDDMLAPDADRYCAISPLGQVELIDSLKNAPNPGAEIGNQYLRGSIKKAMNLNFMSTPSVFRATLGTNTNVTPLTVGTTANGATTLSIDGLSAATATIKKGTKFTLGVVGTSTAVYAVDPETKAVLPYLKQFSVTGDFTGSSSAITNLSIEPPIYDSTDSRQNVSQLPPNDCEVIQTLGSVTAGNTYAQNPIWQKDAVQLVALPLRAAMKKDTHTFTSYNGVPIRVGFGAWDARNDDEILRIDAAFAWVITRPEHCAIVHGA
jgi:hypothetical protein